MSASRIGPVVLACLLVMSASCSKESSSAAAEKSAPPPAAAGGASAQQVKLCEHRVPAELCTRCNPDLIDVFKAQDDWCEAHGVPESQCFQCHPDLTFTARSTAPKDWCKEHAVPESKCTKCNPSLVAKYIEVGDYCREHGFPESVCPYCHPELVKAAGAEPPTFPEPGTRVRLASAETVREAGIQTRRVEKRPFARTLDVVGQLDFNNNRLAWLSARSEALVLEVRVDVGDEVKAGQPLAVVTSGAVGADQGRLSAAQARLEAARAALVREQTLVERGISARKSLEQAQAEVAAAEGERAAARASLTAAGASVTSQQGTYVLTAPFSGTVVARDAVPGRHVGAGQTLLQVADLSTMWALLEVPEADAGAVRAGQKVTLTFESMPGETREATLTRVGASVDPATRTVRARVELPNPEGSLKAGLFLRARVQVAAEHEALLVPREAIQRAEGRTLVFVKKEPGLYEPVAVELGAGGREEVEVVKGLSPGVEVVTTGAFLLKTEILKESIGAGCCETEGGE
ncbi:efflux RND transporter periplasmic adaptor subunit [Pyxidicoccus fallax]|uniref:Efflux RND transporter periplasmic adaptor subunit n=1 Tax=Pyxidicoccus fallax TaxID=394095 RepID=A0A848LFZ6_9BACT|nr:efflux RND transporter periplasmic adaptor subunit [Pyxidicoccus fallax]NMO14618.1 efflux RND transporter periplasmic adaptor subunit [Pyxidicoccus fallax]NPC77382.1 efflux RND transporter periplasmic adaptor subunit [Pyxidicoccus fallax]